MEVREHITIPAQSTRANRQESRDVHKDAARCHSRHAHQSVYVAGAPGVQMREGRLCCWQKKSARPPVCWRSWFWRWWGWPWHRTMKLAQRHTKASESSVGSPTPTWHAASVSPTCKCWSVRRAGASCQAPCCRNPPQHARDSTTLVVDPYIKLGVGSWSMRGPGTPGVPACGSGACRHKVFERVRGRSRPGPRGHAGRTISHLLTFPLYLVRCYRFTFMKDGVHPRFGNISGTEIMLMRLLFAPASMRNTRASIAAHVTFVAGICQTQRSLIDGLEP